MSTKYMSIKRITTHVPNCFITTSYNIPLLKLFLPLLKLFLPLLKLFLPLLKLFLLLSKLFYMKFSK